MIQPGKVLGIQVGIPYVLQQAGQSKTYKSAREFQYTVPAFQPINYQPNTLEINLIITVLLVGSCTIIFACRWIELRGEVKKKMSTQRENKPIVYNI